VLRLPRHANTEVEADIDQHVIVGTIQRNYASMGKARRNSLAHAARDNSILLSLLLLRRSAATIGRGASFR
jgi:hypothetical protein